MRKQLCLSFIFKGRIKKEDEVSRRSWLGMTHQQKSFEDTDSLLIITVNVFKNKTLPNFYLTIRQNWVSATSYHLFHMFSRTKAFHMFRKFCFMDTFPRKDRKWGVSSLLLLSVVVSCFRGEETCGLNPSLTPLRAHAVIGVAVT